MPQRLRHYLTTHLEHMFPSGVRIWGLDWASNTGRRGEKHCVGEARVTSPPAILRPACPSLLPPVPSPPSHPCANCFVLKTIGNPPAPCPRAAPATCIGHRQRGGSPALVSSQTPSPQPPPSRGKGADSHSYQAFKRFHGNTTLCSILASLTRGEGRHVFKRLLA